MIVISSFNGAARVVAALLLFGAGGCSTLNKMTEDFENRWDNPDEVLAEMAEAEPLSEEDKADLRARLNALAESGDCDMTRQSADRVLSFDETNVEARLAIAECDLKARNLAGAETLYKDVADDTGDKRALRGLGLIASLEGDGVMAEEYLRRAIEIDEEDWRVWNALGYALDQQSKWEEAEESYLKAAELDEEKGAPFNNLGMSYLQQEKFKDAASAFAEAAKREPELEAAHLNLRVARALDGDYSGALVGASEEERAVVLNNIGVAAMTRGDYETAKRYFRRALDANPKFYSVAYDNLERATHLSAK